MTRPERFIPPGVCAVTLLAAAWLAWATRAMTCIPTDAQSLYLPAAQKIPALQYLSQIHDISGIENAFFLYGKELSILQFSWVQRLLHDITGLWPLTLTCIAAWGASAILVFFVARRYWGRTVALVVWGLFVTSFWPYVYVLMVKHQPIGLFYVLLAVFGAQRARLTGGGLLWLAISSCALGTALFSSTIAGSFLPFYAAALWYQNRLLERNGFAASLRSGAVTVSALLAGFLIPFLWVNYPDILRNVQGYARYIQMSSQHGLFYYFQDGMREWISDPAHARGGWVWVGRYLTLVLPVLFPVYLASMGFVLVRGFRRRVWISSVGLVFLSLSPLILAELKGVAQYGANYFAAFTGILLLTGYALSVVCKEKILDQWTWGKKILGGILALHVLANAAVFFGDVFPTRMSEARLSAEMDKKGITELGVYYDNYMTRKIVSQLDPALLRKLSVRYIDNVYQARTGYVLVPPLVVSSVYLGLISPNTDFDLDPYLNELLEKGVLKDYAEISLKTMASSRIWRQETEIASYRDLILRHFGGEYQKKSRVWVLDAGKLWKDREKYPVRSSYRDFVERGVRQIGAVSTAYRYKGIVFHVDQPTDLSVLGVRIYKEGRPDDALVAYVYKGISDLMPGWVPAGDLFASRPVPARNITSDPRGGDVRFVFDKALSLAPGDYHVVIYRTGRASDRDLYRVFVDEGERLKYLQAARIP